MCASNPSRRRISSLSLASFSLSRVVFVASLRWLLPVGGVELALPYETLLAIIPQRPRMDRHDGIARHHLLEAQGRERGVQASEIGEILDHGLDHGIGQLVRLPRRGDEQVRRAKRRD